MYVRSTTFALLDQISNPLLFGNPSISYNSELLILECFDLLICDCIILSWYSAHHWRLKLYGILIMCSHYSSTFPNSSYCYHVVWFWLILCWAHWRQWASSSVWQLFHSCNRIYFRSHKSLILRQSDFTSEVRLWLLYLRASRFYSCSERI